MAFKPVSPHPNFPKLEEEILRFWEKEKIFEKSLEQTKDAKPFVFYEGPPTANAAPGVHHVLTRAFKDVICRYQTMRGRYVERKAGWDTHGLPVELQVEKQLGISGKKQIESLKATVKGSIAYFNKLCKDSVWQFKSDWEKMTKRMGYWIDMAHPYITYEPKYIEKVWGVLKQIWERGLIYQGHKVVPYCPRCGTALSSHEVAQGYETVTDTSVTVKFQITNHKSQTNSKFKIPNDKPTYLLSWTTTPWTLPGNVALAIGENIEYALVKADNENYILAKDRMAEMGIKGEMVKEIKGHDLIGLEYEPLFDIPALKSDKSYKVYPASFVNTEEGTGIVHTAVMYGEDDYQLGEKVGLPKHHIVDEEGRFTEDLKAYGLAGLPVKHEKTEKKIIDYLKDKNFLFKEERYEHDYPFCWRCGEPLLYYARNSWFIRMSKLRDELISNNQQINWVPAYLKEGRFGEWLREVKDWAISRERYWGTPLPFWICSDCGEIEVIGELDSRFRGNDNKITDLHRPYIDNIKLECEQCGGEAERVPEVLDVWFDSGAMPFASDPAGFPADYICEAVDQTRGWFYTLLAISTALGKGPAYKSVISTGLILDERGQKMSKSKGNIVVPQEIFDEFGADVLRWYLFTVNQPGDAKLFAKKELEVVRRKTFNLLWNVFSYYATYSLQEKSRELGSQGILDKWILVRTQALVNDITQYLEDLDTFRAARGLDEYLNEFSTWYIRRNRGRSDQTYFAVLHDCLTTLLQLLAPFAPFVAEEIYKNLSGEQSVHLIDWPKAKKLSKTQIGLLKQMQEVRKIVEEAHALRAEAGIKLRQPLASLKIKNQKSKIKNELLDILKDEVNVKEIVEGDKLELDTTITPELEIEGLAAELTRQIQQLRKEVGLQIGQMAALSYETESDKIKKAMEMVDQEKTYLSALRQAQGLTGKKIEVEGDKLVLVLKLT